MEYWVLPGLGIFVAVCIVGRMIAFGVGKTEEDAVNDLRKRTADYPHPNPEHKRPTPPPRRLE